MWGERGHAMKKLVFVLGLGIGFLLGSKVGPGPYKDLEDKVRSLRERPDVDRAVGRVKAVVGEQATEAVEKVNEKLPASPKRAAV